MINRCALQCVTCGHKTIIRTAVGHGDYQEFAFACRGCGLEIRYGMKLPLNRRMARVLATKEKHPKSWFKEQLKRISKMPKLKYVNLKNAKFCGEEGATETRTFDGENLNPVDEAKHFSPFIATAFLPRNLEKFALHQGMRKAAVEIFWPQIHKLLTHFERKNWKLFDKQLQELELEIK